MKTTNKLMLIIATVSILFIFIGSIMAWYYIETNNLNSSSLISTDNLHFYENEDLTLNGLFSSNSRSSQYTTLIFNKTYNFDVVNKLFISTTTEHINFVNEDRNDIYVEYSLEYPNTSKYTNTFNCELLDDKLVITSAQNINNLLLDKIYSQNLTIHLPNDYKFSDITIETKSSSITNNNLYYNTDNLSLISLYSDINLKIYKPLNSFNLYGDFGELNLTILSPIQVLNINCDNGDINLIAHSFLGNCNISSDLGDFYAEIYDVINGLNFTTVFGDIETNFFVLPNAIISANSRFGATNSDIITPSNSSTTFNFSSEFGDIDIIDSTTKGPNN